MTVALVTAIGGDLGQGIARALHRHGVQIVGCDTNTLHAWTIGPFCDAWFHAVPLAGDPLYVASLFAIADQRACEVVIPASDAEITALATYPHVGASPTSLVARFMDKWETSQACERVGVPFARSWLDTPRLTGHWYRKYRRGAGGRGHGEQIMQEFLDGPEYTVAVWASTQNSADIRALALRRELRGGATYRCWYEPDEFFTQEAERVGRDYTLAFGMQGSFNVQGRYVAGRGFVPFEVNPRFSSTVSLRDAMGFCDAWWSVQEALGRGADPMPQIKRARGVRFWDERVQVDGEWR